MLKGRGLWGLPLAGVLLFVNVGAQGTDAPLADAVQHRDTPRALSLLKTQVDVNATQGDGATALHWAVYFDDAEFVALLIDSGAEVNMPSNYGVTPLVLASENGNAVILEQLMKSGTDPNDPNCNTALFPDMPD
mgnify:CR=1 FL=1